jgi:hypothetical protein
METQHLVATVDTLGQQMPKSLAASASAIRMSFGVGESFCCQAQFIAAMLTASLAPPAWSDARDAEVLNPVQPDRQPLR